MKFHFPLVDAVRIALRDTFENKYYADKVIERVLRSNPKMGSNDRAFVAESTYDCVRWWRLLNEVTDNKEQTDDVSLLNIISAYFYIFHNEKPQWKENYGIDFSVIQTRYEEVQGNRAIIQSIPDWLDQLGEAELGASWDSELVASNQQADVCLRTNTLKTNRTQLIKDLNRENIEVQEDILSPTAIRLKSRKNVFSSELFKNGCFEVQDSGSQCIVDFANVKPCMRVIDACAGAGGKTLQLAAQMENKGRIIALDTVEYKLNELKKRARRAGAGIIETKLIETSKTVKRLDQSADLVLLDAPCSGLGTLRRNPDAKWKLTASFVQDIQKKQKDILQNYPRMVKPGGILVYATCSLLPSENERQVEHFLKLNPNFTLEDQKWLSPAKNNCDGFYMARLINKPS